MALDPAISDQLTTNLLLTANQNTQANGIHSRNIAAANGAVLTLGVQQVNAAGLKQQTKITPMEAAAAANVIESQDPSHFAGLGTAAGIPGSGMIRAAAAATPAASNLAFRR